MSHAGTDTSNYAVLISRFTSSGQWDRVLETAREWLSKDAENVTAHMAAGRALLNVNGKKALNLSAIRYIRNKFLTFENGSE
jgi:hypothetical protein